MSLAPSSRRPAHLVLVAGCVSIVLALLGAGTADAAAPAAARRAAAVAVAVPSPGDVSYAMVRVRVTPGVHLAMPAGVAGAVGIFSGRVGGLAIRARAANWRALRATTRVYVVASHAQGAPADERDVALFVVRRTGHGGGAGARALFTVANARAVVGSFWVHGVDRRGYADVFHARNIFSTALANWSRYTLALKLARAIKAALHPRVRSVRPVASAGMTTAALIPAAGRARNSGPWTGGQRANARVKAMYSLLLGALHSPPAWGAFKGSPAVPSFIADELHNPSLANRWRTVVAKVPVIVPDKYAALAQEEKQFTRVSAPRLGHRMVEIADFFNSYTGTASDAGTASTQSLTINNPDAKQKYGGTVSITSTDPGAAAQTCSVTTCTYSYSSGQHTIRIRGVPDSGAALLSTDGCDSDMFLGDCTMTLNGSGNRDGDGDGSTVTESFAQSARLTVSLAPAGSVHDFSSNDPLFLCPAQPICTENLATGSTVTFTADPYGYAPSSWTGCDRSSGDSCTVTMTGPRSVTAELDYMLTASVQAAAGSGGTITTSLGAINCGVVASGVTPCAASIQAGQRVTLTAHPDSRSTFSSWSGCPDPTGSTCTVTMSQAQTVEASFAVTPPVTYLLSVSVTNNQFAPTHTGYVTSSPGGIKCGAVPTSDTATCNASFDAGTAVTLTATINQGVFELWTGCDTMTNLTCTVLMGQARGVTAQFG